jgi:predicted TIM-barrel fold metal-dependent hydrolase
MKNALIAIFCLVFSEAVSQQPPHPVIDIHLHAYSEIAPEVNASWAGEAYARELSSPQNADSHMERVLNEMEKNNIVLALTSSTSMEALAKWKQNSPGIFLTGIQTGENGQPLLSPDSLKILFASKEVDFLGELGLQYYGLSPDDPIMHPYYKVAEENGIPVCLHTGLGPPGGPHSFAPAFRTTLGRPSLFEPVLVRHPKLKAFIAHAGYPYIAETIAMMYVYPDLYADIGVLAWALPKKAFHATLKELIDAGFGKRIMFGSDQMIWPEAISIAIKTVKETPFLSEDELRDILYNNAAHFLELPPEVQAAHQN